MNSHRRSEFLICCSHHYSSSRHSERSEESLFLFSTFHGASDLQHASFRARTQIPTLAGLSPVFAALTQNTLGYTPSPPKFDGLARHNSSSSAYGSGTLFPSLRRTAFPIWLLLDLPATRTMDRKR